MPDCFVTRQRRGTVVRGVGRKPRLLAREPHGANEVPQLPVLSVYIANRVQGMPLFLDALVHVDSDDLTDEQIVAAQVQGLAHDTLDVDGTLGDQRHGCGRTLFAGCLLYTSPSPRDRTRSRMPSSA